MPLSYNGLPASTDRAAIGVEPFVVAGVSFPGGVKKGDTTVILGYVARRFHAEVEHLVDGWCWGWSYRKNRNAGNLSNHSSGSAIDCNAPNHPNGKHGTFTAKQVEAIRRILADCGGVVRWGGDYAGTRDEMHFELTGTAAEQAAVARRLSHPAPKPAPTPAPEDELTKDEHDALIETRDLLRALVAPRRADHADTDASHLSLGDVITADEKAAGK